MSGPMKVFEMAALEGYEWVLPVNERDFEQLRFDGQPRSASWAPLEMRTLQRDDHGRTLEYSDCPSCSGGDMLMLREKAVAALRETLEQYGEILPLRCSREALWTLNVTRLVHALDERHSDLLRSPESGRILRVKKPAFRPETLKGVQLFKLAESPRGLIYVTDNFVTLVERCSLRGIAFKQVWAAN